MVLGHLTFGVMCAATAALHSLAHGAAFGMALVIYSLVGTLGLLLSASFSGGQAETSS